ncbi:hypothetical protein [Rhodococcus sp. EPR-157]|uniref:hypothetical protein n=1 Tax=Rhodococcus sp. EPR-157 TaxID=1813677 RepID=UPI001E5E789C|nr:hypothetical protein [Rhodococcus sp. EPR-157]
MKVVANVSAAFPLPRYRVQPVADLDPIRFVVGLDAKVQHPEPVQKRPDQVAKVIVRGLRACLCHKAGDVSVAVGVVAVPPGLMDLAIEVRLSRVFPGERSEVLHLPMCVRHSSKRDRDVCAVVDRECIYLVKERAD